jgi:hypothetical protein
MTVPTVVNAPWAVGAAPSEEGWAVPSDRSWSEGHLRQALDELCLRYGYPFIDHLDHLVGGDGGPHGSDELAACCYLAAVVACALRASSACPPLAFGPWSEAPLLGHLDAVIPPVRAERDLFSEPPSSPSELETDRSARPIFLVPEFADDELLAMLLADPLLIEPRLDQTAGQCRVVRAGVRRPELAHIAPDSRDQAPDTTAIECVVEVRESRLLGALRHGLALVERETGARVAPGEPWGAAWEPIAPPPLEWMALAPELPAWARVVDALGATPTETLTRWLALAPIAPSSTTVYALRTRAYLVHHLAALAAYSPAIGCAALLSVAEDSGATLVATHARGVHILPPSVQSAEADWVTEGPAEAPCVRPPLRVLRAIGTIAGQITLSCRVDGPFKSVRDLLRRVPATAHPDALRCLLEAGALDQVGDGPRMRTDWSEVAAWCTAVAADPAAPEPMVDGIPVFGAPVEQEVPLTDVRGWWERFGSVGDPPDASAALPAMRVGGSIDLANVTMRGSRPWCEGGEVLTVIAAEDGAGAVRVILAAGENGAAVPLSIAVLPTPSVHEGAASVWVESTLVTAPLSQVEVIVPLLGDRDRDLDRLTRLRAILLEHQGDDPVRLVLSRADSRKVVERSSEDGVTWSAALVDALEMLLGPHCATLTDSAQGAGTPGPLKPATPLS